METNQTRFERGATGTTELPALNAWIIAEHDAEPPQDYCIGRVTGHDEKDGKPIVDYAALIYVNNKPVNVTKWAWLNQIIPLDFPQTECATALSLRHTADTMTLALKIGAMALSAEVVTELRQRLNRAETELATYPKHWSMTHGELCAAGYNCLEVTNDNNL